jgi:predicted Zn-dependent protease
MKRENIKLLLIVVAVALLGVGCANVAKLGTQLGQGAGVITEEQAESLNRTTDALEKTFEDITPEQEYYIGRAVAATILQTYKPLNDPEANAYLNNLGQTLAMVSDRPETFGGYHFLLLDSDDVNAFAAPGGLILVTRGLVQCCRTEADLAAVLAHEIGHVQNKDGLRAIKKSRLTYALTTISMEAARNFGNQDIKELAAQFEGGIDDIMLTLVNNGYARDLEFQADQAALGILDDIGYDKQALRVMLKEMDKRLKPGGLDFAKTHPSPSDRIVRLGAQAMNAPLALEPAARKARFAAAVGGI